MQTLCSCYQMIQSGKNGPPNAGSPKGVGGNCQVPVAGGRTSGSTCTLSSAGLPEAMAAGAIVLSSATGGVTEAIIDGETGLLTSVTSNKSLEDAMRKLINDKDLRIKMGEKARIRGIKFFSQEVITFEVVKLYKKLL